MKPTYFIRLKNPGNHDPKGQFKVCTKTPHYILICIHSWHNTPHGKVHNNINIPRYNFHNKPNIPHLGNNAHPLTLLKLPHGPNNGETHRFHTTHQFSSHHHQHIRSCNWPRMPLSQCRPSALNFEYRLTQTQIIRMPSKMRH